MISRWTAVAIALGGMSPALAQPPPPVQTLAQAAEQAAAAGFSGVIAAAGPDGRFSYERAFGFADRERRLPHRVHRPWPWASVTKQVTAALVMREVDRGTLALDQPVTALLPDFSGTTAQRITVRHLLQHLSGLPNPSSGPANASGMPLFYLQSVAVPSYRASVRSACAAAPAGEPGSAFSYNNCDYYLLGEILERVTGRAFVDLVRGTGNRGPGLRALALAPDRRAFGLGPIIGYGEGGKRAPFVNFRTYGSAGGLVGTARDLLAFDHALMSGSLVSPSSRAEMWKGEPRFGFAALGAWSFTVPLKGCAAPVALVERRGAVSGIQVRNLLAPELGRALVAFTNDAQTQFGEIWQGRGLSFELASAAFCGEQPATRPR
jgi:CubicO group peptidase (beta-lactamase class C family)